MQVPAWRTLHTQSLLMLTAAAFSVLCIAAISQAEIIDRALALVGGVVITQSDVSAALELGLVNGEPTADPTGTALSQLIDRQLILIEVDRYAPPEPTVEALGREISLVRAKFSSQAAYERALLRSGIDEARVRQLLRDELRIRAYLDQRFTVPTPNDEEVERYYREHPQEFTREGERISLPTVRPEIVRSLAAARREMLVKDWVSGLRRRAAITDLSLPRQ